MAPSIQAHNRSHSLLLLQKLLNLRDSASPLTLVLDSLEQSATPVLREFTTRAKISRTKVIFVSFATVKRPHDADVFVKARGKPLRTLRSDIVSHCPSPAAPTAKDGPPQRALIIIDSLNTLAATEPRHLSAFLSSIITPAASVVAVYHSDVPLVIPPGKLGEYEPHPLTVLSHLATAVLRVTSLHHAVERRRAQNRSLPEPEFGLAESREGVLIGLGAGGGEAGTKGGVVVEMELRRRSGRAVAQKFVLAARDPQAVGVAGGAGITVLADHPLFAPPEVESQGGAAGGQGGEEEMETTFNLGLTEKQRRDREGIVLPYFDAQTDIGAGEGGRILYEMGREDDFDDEEDEI
ncbi:Elongator complex protein 5 [Pleurostoma richardsiae]|uniref:Elongator complex protein 5 n=1 Tax=Pleurostoma richardsiae TaxID=41990 RepID=A0AA38RAW5_9PEZI|nr:Elongator complex protein 5 [Pleurostoma richardsiae]